MPIEQGRSSNTAIQSATYGEPIPLVVGRMRTAGNLIWTSGIRETAAMTGGGKRSSGAATSYSYSASFAVGLAARRIGGIQRIWADGKLLRDVRGGFTTPVMMRVYSGDGDQGVDPLIAAAEGVTSTPAYRGLAYVVFEDLPLGDFGNRIPNLTFEIVGDADGAEGFADTLTIEHVIGSLAAAAGYAPLPLVGKFPAVSGYIAARCGSLADALAPLLAVSDAAIVASRGLRIEGPGGGTTVIDADAVDARLPGEARAPERSRRAATERQPASLELAFYDTSRDYQPGVQRACRSGAARVEHRSIAAAMSPVEAKSLATSLLINGQTARVQRRVRLSWRHVGIAPGSLVHFSGETTVWRVREARFENFIVHLDLERRLDQASANRGSLTVADGGRALLSGSQPAGPTTLHVLDLPPLPGEQPATPRLWIAGSGAEAGWRRAAVLASVDGGDSFAVAGNLDGGTTIGVALTALADAASWGWDETSTIDIELLSDRHWLEPRTATAVLDGANMALVGDELIQFRGADAVGPRRFRLQGLLRGRRGTEAMTPGHVVGERFVLVDPARMLALDLPLDLLARDGLARAAGVGDTDAAAVPFHVGGQALRPLSPAHLRASEGGGDVSFRWVRRSRAGFAWTDFVDAPLGEVDERYVIEVRLDGRLARTRSVSQAAFRYLAADRLADGGGTTLEFRVARWSGAVGPGADASIVVNV